MKNYSRGIKRPAGYNLVRLLIGSFGEHRNQNTRVHSESTASFNTKIIRRQAIAGRIV